MTRIGILGGAFNPPHIGHLRPAREVFRSLGLDRLLFVPSGEHPLKRGGGAMIAAAHRLAMIEEALDSEPDFEACDVEIRRPGTSYTVDTLEELRRTYPDGELVFLVGGDILAELHLWKRWRQIFDHAHLVMMQRPGYSGLEGIDAEVAGFIAGLRVDEPHELACDKDGGHRFLLLSVTPAPVSSTMIRARAADGADIGALVPEAVADYIKRHQLYLSKQV